tara:strand:- start:696 stop:872 length:177 start_codon:yes stop_codon:yes gene_type:complete
MAHAVEDAGGLFFLNAFLLYLAFTKEKKKKSSIFRQVVVALNVCIVDARACFVVLQFD